MRVSPGLRQDVRLFLHGYVGYLEAVKLRDLYISLLEMSKDIVELEDRVGKAIMDSEGTGDHRSAEALRSLHERIRKNHFGEHVA